MTSSLWLAVLASGFIYGITPGPGVLAVFGIGAARGRRAGAGFLCGHLLGDVIWCSTALIAIVGAREFGSTAFNVLGLISGLYLFWLGLRAVRAKRSSVAEEGPARKPFAHGIFFGLTNPKAYPVAVATFTALLSGRAEPTPSIADYTFVWRDVYRLCHQRAGACLARAGGQQQVT